MQHMGLISELQCTLCRAPLRATDDDKLACASGHIFKCSHGIPDLTPSAIGAPPIYDDPDYVKWLVVSSQALRDSYSKGSIIEKVQDAGHRYLEAIADRGTGLRLDLGCGFGRHFDFLAEKNNVIGFDANLHSLLFASQSHPEATFLKGNMTCLPFPENYFEVIYAVYSLEHVYQLDSALGEIKRVLKKGGQLLVGLPAEGGFFYNGLRQITTIPYFTHKYGIDYGKIIRIEHCNTAATVLRRLANLFRMERSRYWPFGISSLHANLILAVSFRHD